MAYNEPLAERIRRALLRKRGISEKKMFGGLSFLLKGKMFCGVLKDNFVLRVDPEMSGKLLRKPHTRPMDFTGRPMKGFIYVGPRGYKSNADLKRWLDISFLYVSSLKK